MNTNYKNLILFSIIFFSLFGIFASSVYAEIFFQDGFESGVLINQQIWEWIAYSPNDPCYSDGQIVPTTEDRFSGAYSAKFTLPAGDMCTSMYSQFSRSVGQGGDIYFRFRLKYLANREWILGGGDKVAGFFGNSRMPGGEWILFTLERGYHDTTEIPVPNDPHMAQPLIYVAAANTQGWRPCNDPDGSYFCQNIDRGNPFYITAGQWYTVEIYVKVDAYGVGKLKLWINGRQLIDINNIYTIRGVTNPGFYRFELGGTLNQPDYVFPVDTVSYWDDIIISDTCNSCDSPSAQIINPTNSGTYTTTASTINLSGTATDPGGTNIGVTSVSWSNNRGGSGTASGITNWSVSNIPLQSGQNIITVTATDGDRKTGTDVLIVNPVTSDTQSPSVPAGLSAQAVSSSQINLSWTASTDNVGVSGYRIYRCTGSGCAPSTQIATSTISSYSNTGLAANTTYVYRVAAYDAAGNVSGQSSSANATTQATADATPPAAPTGLTVM